MELRQAQVIFLIGFYIMAFDAQRFAVLHSSFSHNIFYEWSSNEQASLVISPHIGLNTWKEKTFFQIKA